jgi:hypothetical protein
VAAEADLTGAKSFQAARKEVRTALSSDGVAAKIEQLVGELLEPVAVPIA